MSTGLSLFVFALVAVNVLGAAWLIRWSSATTVDGETTGHRWDGDIVEGNNPLPRWWLGLFWLTILWGIVYLVLYPSFGSFSLLGWSQQVQYEAEIAQAEERYGALFAEFAATPIEELSNDAAAMSAGRNLFANNCAQCHGSDARGARGFPDLTDAEWNWGGAPAQILATIQGGRTGVMPPFGAALADDQRELLADYVLHLAGRDVPAARVDEGAPAFQTFCAACHGTTGAGNALLGAPALANELWLHGADRSTILDVITNGRSNTMPAQAPVLGADRTHVLAAYVYGRSREMQ